MILAEGPEYYDRFAPNPDAKGWLRLLAVPGRPIQSADWNESQTVLNYKIEQLANYFLKDGTYLTGGAPDLSTVAVADGIEVTIPAGRMWAIGDFHNVPAGTVTITGFGTEVIGIKITPKYKVAEGVESETVEVDPTLLDPAVGSEDEGTPGCDRLIANCTFVLDDDQAVPIAYFRDGQYIRDNSGSRFLDLIKAIMARRTYEQSGSFIATLPKISLVDPDVEAINPALISVIIEGGIGFPMGVEVFNQMTRMSILRPQTTNSVVNEAQTIQNNGGYANGFIPVNNGHVRKISLVTAQARNDSVAMTRQYPGQYGALYQDTIPAPYNSVVTVHQVYQGPYGSPTTTYVSGVDYNISGDNIIWLPAGNSPTTSYNISLTYTRNLTKGIRRATAATNVQPTGSGSVRQLPHTKLLRKVKLVNGSTTYVEGTDYTINLQTGEITWIISAPANASVNATYQYWVSTIEGDYLSRDSFEDANGDNNLLYQMPEYADNIALSGIVDYGAGLYLTGTGAASTGGNSLVAGSLMLTSYEYAIGRVDTLVWNTDGTFAINAGIPVDGRPIAPATPVQQLPICDFHLPAEAFAADVRIEWYDNLTLKVTDLRGMFNQIQTLQFNQTQDQLAMATNNIQFSQGPTAKLGFFTDNLADNSVLDLAHPDFAGSIDFFSRAFHLPRYRYSANGAVGVANAGAAPVINGTGASKHQDIWLPAFTHVTALSQPYYSQTMAINSYTDVNFSSSVALSPATIMGISEELNIVAVQKGSIIPDFGIGPTTGTSLIPGVQSAYKGRPQTAAQIINGAMQAAIAPLTKSATQIGQAAAKTKSGTLPVSLQQPVLPDWLTALTSSSANSQSSVTQNKWSTVLSNSQVVPATFSPQVDVTITGTKFRPNEEGIVVYLDDEQVDLTPVSGNCVADTNYPGSVKITDGSGTFQAKFRIPAGVPTGTHAIKIVGQLLQTGVKTVTSYATAVLQTGGFVEQITEVVSVAAKVPARDAYKLPIYTAANRLGFWPKKPLLASVTNGIGMTIAELVIQAATTAGVTLNESTFTSAVGAMFAASKFCPQPPAAALALMWDAVAPSGTVTSRDPSQLAQAIYDIESTDAPFSPSSPFQGTTLQTSLYQVSKGMKDPLAQTFTLQDDCMISSIDLWVHGATNDSTPAHQVGVVLVEVENGFPTETHLGPEAWKTGAACIAEMANPGYVRFTFPKPMFVQGGKDYAFVVMCDDLTTSVEIATLGATDITSGLLITANPAAGVLLVSPNKDTWQSVPASDIRFNINIAKFTNTTATLALNGPIPLGSITVGSNTYKYPIFNFNVPYALPSAKCSVSFEYTIDGSNWLPFQPMIDVDLGQVDNALQGIRMKLQGSEFLAPVVHDAPVLDSFIYVTPGAYVPIEFTVPATLPVSYTGEVEYVDLIFDVSSNVINSGILKATPHINFPIDDVNGFLKMTENTAARVDLGTGWTTVRYSYRTGNHATNSAVIAGTVANNDIIRLTMAAAASLSGKTGTFTGVSLDEDDVARIQFQGTWLNSNVAVNVDVTLGASETLVTLATAFKNAINANTTLSAAGIYADIDPGDTDVVRITWPNNSALTTTFSIVSGTGDEDCTFADDDNVHVYYKAVTSNTVNDVAEGLRAAFNANVTLSTFGAFAVINPSDPDTVIVSWPNPTPGSVPPNILSGDSPVGSETVTIPGTPQTSLLKNHIQSKIVLENTSPIAGSSVCTASPRVRNVRVITR